MVFGRTLIKTFIKTKMMCLSVFKPVSGFVCSIIASIIFGFESVTKMANPAIKRPRVVTEKSKPNPDQALTSLIRLWSSSTSENELTARAIASQWLQIQRLTRRMG